jgi:hypothetical protein
MLFWNSSWSMTAAVPEDLTMFVYCSVTDASNGAEVGKGRFEIGRDGREILFCFENLGLAKTQKLPFSAPPSKFIQNYLFTINGWHC